MLNAEAVSRAKTRHIEIAKPFDDELGPLKLLPGIWKNTNADVPFGWNCIALPFVTDPPPAGFNYRLMVNHYRETLQFFTADKGATNRGIERGAGGPSDLDQFVVALDYQQLVEQVAVDEFPKSGPDLATDKLADPGAAIHHEPGLFLFMTNHTTDGINIARLGTVPHGDSLLAMGRFDAAADIFDGPPDIPAVNGFPEGVLVPRDDTAGGPDDLLKPLESLYMGPYKHFHDNPFFGTVPAGTPGFPGFNPVHPEELLRGAQPAPEKVKKTTRLDMTTSATEAAGILNIPFIVKHANATSMKSTFWIMELDEPGVGDEPKLVMQYLQVVMLDFFPRRDGIPGLIGWPHVSINTLEKVANVGDDAEVLTSDEY